jgi:hypothetical protein
LKLWKQFSVNQGFSWKKFSEKEVVKFICWGGGEKGLKGKTIQIYLGSLRTLVKLRQEIFAGNGKTVENFLLRGIGNSGKRSNWGKIQNNTPVNLEILCKIKKGLKRLKYKKISKHCVWTACLIAFWGAFRLGELFAKERGKFDQFSDLVWSDITKIDSEKGVVIHVKSAKIPGPPGNRAELFPVTESFFCPIKALKKLKYLQKRSCIWGENLPVFRRSSGKNLTKSTFLRVVNKALSKVGGNITILAGKSFRSGILSALKTLPQDFQESHLKALGRWKENSYRFYMWKGPINFSQVFKSVTEHLLKGFSDSP